MDINFVLDYALTLAPWVANVFAVLGALTVVGTTVDALVDDSKDGGFMKKILAIPVLGSVLNAMKKFSPFNTKDK
jgi:hypothetical protein